MCKKHTQDSEIRPFCPGFCLKSLSFLSFAERCKNQGSFCKCFIINKVLFLCRTCAWGKLRKRSVFLSAPIFVWDNLPSKFLPCKLTLWGEEVKTLASFKSNKNSVKFFFTKPLHKGFFSAFCHCPDHYRNRCDMPLKNEKIRNPQL